MAEPTTQKPARKPAPNRSLRRKQAARLTAIRALYSRRFNEDAPAQTIDAWADSLIADQQEAIAVDDEETAFAEAPERAMLVTLLESAEQHEPAIGELIRDHMGEKWNSERMGPLLEAILRIAVAELMAKKDKTPNIIISEYVLLTEAYFDDNEVSFVNGILASIAKKLRD
jgi:transcription antitermination protein NusB